MSFEQLLPLKPHLVPKIWGSNRLNKLKNLSENSGEPLGESWEVSCLEEGTSAFKDVKLTEITAKLGKELNYLVKFIVTQDNLSVQTHPDDEYAREHESSLGKNECWVILDAEPGSGIYLGFKEGVTKPQFEKALRQGDDLTSLLNFYPVNKGEFFFVPAGTVHAIGKGLLLAEVQQSSGVTYRVWDWNRVDQDGNSRELHVEKALDVLEFSEEKNNLDAFMYDENIFADEFYFGFGEFFNITIFSPAFNEHEIPEGNRSISIINFDQPVQVSTSSQKLILEPFSSCFVNLEAFEKLNFESVDTDKGEFNGIVVY